MRILVLLSWILGLTLFAVGPAAADTDRLIRSALRKFEPLPAAMPGAENDTPERIALGKALFFDTRLSINDQQSCASCHRLGEGQAGVDGLRFSPGAKGELGTRNSPTVLNAGWHKTLFWDGRAKDLADQAKQPILNPVEMAMPSPAYVVEKLAKIPEYRAAFARAFPGANPALTYDNLGEAIASFERTLRSESRFDDFLKGDKTALNAQEQDGLAAFLKVNCVRCHDGALLGGELFEKLGKVHPFPYGGDEGRFAVTGRPEDRKVFKVPSLRNVALTGPWFHNGSGETLPDAVRVMGRIQLDVNLTDQEVTDIVAFLGALNGKDLDRRK
ncbi:MAG: c-type cytochrome [Rhodospirillales bacterium]|nr:c-type cytochrome [Rhodospirillales bacterium]